MASGSATEEKVQGAEGEEKVASGSATEEKVASCSGQGAVAKEISLNNFYWSARRKYWKYPVPVDIFYDCIRYLKDTEFAIKNEYMVLNLYRFLIGKQIFDCSPHVLRYFQRHSFLKDARKKTQEDFQMSETKGKASHDTHETRKRQKIDTKAEHKGEHKGEQKGGKHHEEEPKNFDDFMRLFKDRVSVDEAKAILKENGLENIIASDESLLEICADQLIYGPLEPCPQCNGTLEYAFHEYKCAGFISEWSKCNYFVKEAPRQKRALKVPRNLKNEFITEWEKKHQEKSKLARDSVPKDKPFAGTHILLAGRFRKPQHVWRQQIEKFGGKVNHALKQNTTCVVVPDGDLSAGVTQKITDARSRNIPVVKETWLQDSMTKKEILPYDNYDVATVSTGDIPWEKMTPDEEATQSLMAELKLVGKRGVYKDTELDKEDGHILEKDGILYNCAFTICDQTAHLNQYVILQLIELSSGPIFIYYKKGRTGDRFSTKQRLDQMDNVNDGIKEFVALFEETTGNEFEPWERKKVFTKKPMKFFPVDMADGIDARAGGLGVRQLGIAASHTKLEPHVAELCKLLFAQQTYRFAMTEMGVDSPDLPMGILTDFHIKRCEELLLEFAAYLKKGETDERKFETMCLDFSNKWFSLMHTTRPFIIHEMSQLTELAAPTLETLRDISIASRLIGDMTGPTLDDPMSDRYAKLNCTITPIENDSDDFKMVEKYFKTTLEPLEYGNMKVTASVERVFTCESAAGPSEKDMESMPNKVLIWCGTRTCNLVRCLSTGMIPAIMEAPAPGYLFGRGLYCTDAACKAAQYGFTAVDRPEGVLMLSVVSLGENILELEKPEKDVSEYEKQNVGIKALGKKQPDEKEYFTWKSDVKVPCGSLKPSGHEYSILEYNEYVVYNPKQVKLQFLVQVRYEEV